jgi:hypothetical protein
MRHRIVPFLTAFALLGILLFPGCNGGNLLDKFVPRLSELKLADGSALPQVIDTAQANPTALTEISGLQPGQLVEVMLYKDNVPVYEKPRTAVADKDGKIPLALFYDLGVDQNPNSPTFRKLVQLTGTYKIEVSSNGATILTTQVTAGAQAFSRQGGVSRPTIDVMINTDYYFALGSVITNQPVYIWGRNMLPNEQYALYVVADKAEWNIGDPIADVTGAVEVAATTATQNGKAEIKLVTPAAKVWNAAAPVGGERNFDVIARKIPAGTQAPLTTTLQAGDIINATSIPAFTVQDVRDQGAGQHRAFAVTCTGNGQFQSEFKAGDTLSVWVNPPWRITDIFWDMVGKYVVVHKANWENNDVLVDVSGRPEWDIVRIACSNEAWHPLWENVRAGLYDVIVDVDGNGKYTKGTDILDQGGTDGQGTGIIVAGDKTAVLTIGTNTPYVAKGNQVTVTAELRIIDFTAAEKSVAVSNVPITFQVPTNNASVNPAQPQNTNTDGQASVVVTPTKRGANVQVYASATVTIDGKPVAVTGSCFITTKAAGDLNVVIQ